jgi:hypothetical protein
MSEFEKIALSESLQPIYQGVVEEINVGGNPAFLKRPIRILDLAGGTGVIGSGIKGQCETSLGPLSPAEYGVLVDYVNVDNDSVALDKSPGRTMRLDIADVYQELREEKPFDFVLSINPSAFIPPVEAENSVNDRMPQAIRTQLLNSYDGIKCGFQRITLLSAALFLQKDGIYVFSGFMGRDVFNGTLAYMRKNDLGLELKKDTTASIDDETKNLFVTVDTGRKPGNPDFEKMKAQYGPYRLLSMTMRTAPEKQKLRALLTQEVRNYVMWMNFRATQDRFGSW